MKCSEISDELMCIERENTLLAIEHNKGLEHISVLHQMKVLSDS